MVGEEQTIYGSLGGHVSGTPIPSAMFAHELDSAMSYARVRTDMDRLVASTVEASVGFDKSSHCKLLKKGEKIVAPTLTQLDHRIFQEKSTYLGIGALDLGCFTMRHCSFFRTQK